MEVPPTPPSAEVLRPGKEKGKCLQRAEVVGASGGEVGCRVVTVLFSIQGSYAPRWCVGLVL